jgi:hypothetical protein
MVPAHRAERTCGLNLTTITTPACRHSWLLAKLEKIYMQQQQ